MKRNIITTIEFSKGIVSISAIEKLTTNVVEIFNDSSNINKVNTFLETSLAYIESQIGGKVSKATFVVEPSEQVDQKILLSKNSINILGNSVAKQDIENLVELVKKENDNDKRSTVLVQPLKFEVTDLMTKSYSKAPIHKRGNKLTITSSVTTISRGTYEYILQAAKAVNIEVAQILLKNQTTSFAHLSKNAMAAGAILINITDNQVNLTINKSNSIVASMTYYDFGYKSLLRGIMNEFNCDMKTARDLVNAHSSLSDLKRRVIYSKQIGTEDWTYTNEDLNNIIKKYLLKLFALTNKYSMQKNVSGLPIVFSGKLQQIHGIANFIKEVSHNENVAVYRSMTFVEMNEDNWNSLGVIRFIEIMDSVLGKQYDTIVDTNPNTIRSLRRTEPKSWFAKMKTRLGGKHDWN